MSTVNPQRPRSRSIVFFLSIAIVDLALWWVAFVWAWRQASSCCECGLFIIVPIGFSWLLILALLLDVVAFWQLRNRRKLLLSYPRGTATVQWLRMVVVAVVVLVLLAPIAFFFAIANLR